MNRVIKFRGKRVDNGEWVYGNLINSIDSVEDFQSIIVPIENSNIFTSKNNDDLGIEFWNKVNPETVGQFTGLLDKNGKEIYEWDIVNDSMFSMLSIVEYDEYGTFSPYGHGDYATISDYTEVIGNIHDNKELLK